MKLIVFILLTLMLNPAFAKGFNKCIIDGQTVYTQKNCPEKRDRVAFGKGTFSGINTKGMVEAYNYDALNRRAQELTSQGLHSQAAIAQQKANIVANGGSYRDTKNGGIEVLSNTSKPLKQNKVSNNQSLEQMNIKASGDVPRKLVELAGHKKPNAELEQKPKKTPASDKLQSPTADKEANESE